MIGGRQRHVIETAGELERYAIKVIYIFIETVVAFFEVYILEDEKACCNAESKTSNVEEGINFIFQEVTESDL